MGEVENVRVFVRVRPSPTKLKENHLIGLENTIDNNNPYRNICVVDEKQNLIALPFSGGSQKPFKFDQVFGENASQIDLYRTIAAPIVEKALQGYNGTIFAYGQTGTGKTYTMVGSNDTMVAESKGIIPNTFAHIFTHIARSTGGNSFVVTVTYLEIYNEDVRDLLSPDPTKKLSIRERSDVGVYVKDLMGFTVDSIESITELLNHGNKNRVTRATLMNDVSSRSHAIFTILIESKSQSNQKTTVAKLNLVDLAGSERASRTQATGERLKEASNINLSLSVLGNVISSLVDSKSTHIPYRNSKLTRLLQDSLGGNSKTAMIATISGCLCDYEETVCTLRYAARVKYIQNHAKINLESKGLIESFENEIAELQQKVQLLSFEEQQRKLSSKKSVVSDEDLKEIRQCEVELEATEVEKNSLQQKISVIQKKILVGGENLLEKVQQQAVLLETSGVEIENLDRNHRQLEETLTKKETERIDIEEKYTSLQDEDAGVMNKIRKVLKYLHDVKEDYADKEHEYQREMEALYDNNRLLQRETILATLMINTYIPKEYLKTIESNLVWNSDTQEYQIKGVAYTGNNLKQKNNAIMVNNETGLICDVTPTFYKYAEKNKRDRRFIFDKRSFSAATVKPN